MAVIGVAGLRKQSRRGCPSKRESGQSAVEIAIAFPIVIIVAVIAVNSMLFLSECAQFDRVVRQSIRVHATAPSYGETTAQISSRIQSSVQEAFEEPYLSISVGSEGSGFGFTTYTVTMEFTPTLFGLGMRSEVFGVALPKLRHSTALTVDTYRPGVLL